MSYRFSNKGASGAGNSNLVSTFFPTSGVLPTKKFFGKGNASAFGINMLPIADAAFDIIDCFSCSVSTSPPCSKKVKSTVPGATLPMIPANGPRLLGPALPTNFGSFTPNSPSLI